MQNNEKNLVEEALIQMKNVEEAIAENAKGILASTMKEEINQLVKESLSEQEDEVDVEVDTDDDEEEETSDLDVDTDNMDDVDIDIDTDSDETPIDLTDASDEEILKVFKAMGEDDGIIVKKDGENVHLTDNDADVEYLVKLGESEEDKNLDETMEMDDLDIEEKGVSDDADTDEIINAIFGNKSSFDEEAEEDEGVMYEIEFDEAEEDEAHEMDEAEDYEAHEMDEAEEDEAHEMDEAEEDEAHEMDEAEDYEAHEMDEQNWDESIDESYNPKKAKKSETKESKLKSMKKPKGVGLGSGPKFSYKSSEKGGFKEDKKEGPKTMGTGKPKFEYKKGENMDGKSKVVKKAETKEAARTLGMGSDFREGGLPKPRAHSKANTAIKESLDVEVKMLREKNEEYRKALNVFREKLNEVAIFNSNLAYATRLFTEHSTTKKEKINILRRFDDVESLKESKSLYKSIKEELTKVETKSINESFEKKVNKTVSSGSATTLIESKTYENPQFLRMKDLMSKIG